MVESLVKPGSGSDFLVRMGDMCTELEREWDTVGLQVSASGSGTGKPAAKTPKSNVATDDTDPYFGPGCNPDVPPIEQAGFALALCSRVMRELRDQGRGACVIVRREGRGERQERDGGGGKAADSARQDEARRGDFLLTLAELNMTEPNGR